jgi:hypothetical protein
MILPKKNTIYCLFEIKFKGLELKHGKKIQPLFPKKKSLLVSFFLLPLDFGHLSLWSV